VAVLLAAALSWFFILRPANTLDDTVGLPIREAMGVVRGITYPQAKEAAPKPLPLVLVEWDGQTHSIPMRDPQPTGQRVRVRYVIGKSGRVTIRSVSRIDDSSL
jgi:hypothetical protein